MVHTTWDTCQIWDIYDTYDDTKVHTTWEVPERYLNLSPVGSGAFGQVFCRHRDIQNHEEHHL